MFLSVEQKHTAKFEFSLLIEFENLRTFDVI